MPKKQRISSEQRRKYKKMDPFWGTKVRCKVCEKCSCEACHPNGPCTPQKKDDKVLKRTAKIVRHHDDPPCTARLNVDGSCPECGLIPDMQSLCLWPYCPSCDCPLEDLKCPKCKQIFKSPFS